MHDNDTFAAVAFAVCAMCAIWGCYVAGTCNRGLLEGALHGFFLGPFGLILLALYPRPATADTSLKTLSAQERLLTGILSELQWQHSQKEKEIVRAKAAQSGRA